MSTVTGTVVSAKFVLVSFLHIGNNSAVIDPILTLLPTRHFSNFSGNKHARYLEHNSFERWDA